MNFSVSQLTILKAITSLIFLLILCNCGKNNITSGEDNDVLLKAGNDILTLKEVVSKIPIGLEPSDSTALFHLIIDNWIKKEVLSELAKSKLPNLNEIEKKVEDYRNRLIIAEYLKEMKKGKEYNISSDGIRNLYENHKRDMLTEYPLVKGIYIKIAANQSNLDEIKRLVFCGTDDCIDKLEKSNVGDAIQYDYFMSDWIDWQTIAEQIPYRFFDPDAFLRSTNNFETTYNGSVYLLHISKYLPSGSIPPYEFAAPQIRELMEKTNIRKFEDSLVKSLIEKAMNEGDLVAVGYDPVANVLIDHYKN